VVLFLMMGTSGWWAANAMLWAETPIFVAEAPEVGRAMTYAVSFSGRLCASGGC
jgi:hypothetical protein